MRLTLEEIDRLVRDSNPVPDVGVLAPVELATLAADLQRSSAMPTATEVELNVDSPPPTSRRWTYLAVAAVAVAIVAGVITIAIRNDTDDTAPAATTTPPTTTPATAPTSLPPASAAQATLTPAGTGPRTQLSYDEVDGWAPIDADRWGVDRGEGVAIQYWYIHNLYEDRCGRSEALMSPAPGPSVDDLVTAFSSTWGRYASAPEDATLGGFGGKHMVLTVPTASADCSYVNMNGWTESGQTFPGASRYFQAQGQVQELWILDVAGARQVIAASYYPTTPPEVRDQMNTILESIRIQPAGVTLRPGDRDQAIEVTEPTGWESDQAGVSAPSGNASLAVWTLPHLYIDPCESLTQTDGPDRSGPTVAWVVSVTDWWSRSSGPGELVPPIATPASSKPLGGTDAMYFDVRLPSDLDLSQCDGGQFRLWSDDSGQSKLQIPGQVDRLWVLKGSDNVPLIVDAAYTPDASPEELAQLQQAIDSITVS